MPEHPNVTRIRQLFAAFLAADVATIRDLIPEDATWHFPGRRGHLAGAHHGREAIFTFLLQVRALTDDTFRLELLDVLANDHNAVALFHGSGQRNGKTLANPTCLRMRLVEGRVMEVWEFVWDLYDVDEFWSS